MEHLITQFKKKCSRKKRRMKALYPNSGSRQWKGSNSNLMSSKISLYTSSSTHWNHRKAELKLKVRNLLKLSSSGGFKLEEVAKMCLNLHKLIELDYMCMCD